MTQETKHEVKPRLRFSEFQDAEEWINEPLGDVYSFKVTNSFSRDKLNYKHGSVKNVHYGDIHTKFSTLFNIENEIVPFINPSVSLEKIHPESYCIEGDMIFADASEDLDDVGKSIEIVNLNSEKLLSGLHTLLARQKEKKILVGFGGYLFTSNRVRTQIKKEAQGAKVFGISAGRLSNVDICFPSQKKEQQKIVACLSSVDELIAAQSQKLDVLQTYKKGLLQALFPAEGETVPRLRFPEFRDAPEWEEKLIGEVISLEYGSPLSEQNRKGGTIPVVGSNGVVGYHDQHLVKGPTIVIGRKGSAGQVNWITSDCYPIDTTFYVKNKSVDDYLMPFLMLILERSNLERLKDNGAVPGLNRNEVYSIKLSFPSFSEQQKIADGLFSVDEQITAQTQRLDILKAHKKGLMQQLFPSLDEAHE